jgi:tetratricopeptide (TPR) repeat protein
MSFHYMRLANAEFDRGNRDEALRLSERALTADPSELHLLRDLMRLYRAIGDQKRADAYEEQLRYYSLGSLIVKDLPLAEYQGQAMAGLVKDGTWTHDMLLDVIAYQVWDFAAGIHGQMAERILRVLLEHWPDDADLLFYLAELYHRRGDLDQAEAAYRRVLAAEPQYAQVYLRMGQIFEARFATSEASSVQLSSFREIAQLSAPSSAYLQQAAFNYAQYFALAPEDFLGLKKLAEVCQSLKDARIEDESCRQAASHIKSSGNVSAANAASILDSVAILEEAMEVRTDNRRTVAALLGVEAEDINLGPNLVENGSVEVWQGEKPVGWVRSWMVGQELFNSALFVGGADEFGAFGGQTSARIDGLWIQQGDKLLPRAGFWQYDEANQTLRAVPLMTNTPYMLSFFYYTERVRDGNATVWISADPRVFWDGDLALPNTHRTWRQLVAVGFNRSEAVGTITPLIRSFARGRVQFDDIQLRAVRLREGSVVKVDGMRFRVTDASESIVDFE